MEETRRRLLTFRHSIQLKASARRSAAVAGHSRGAMTLRAHALALIAVLCATTVAAAESRDRWTAVAKAPRAALPDVQVTLGYPGTYVPTWNSPIELRATASRPFNGYIGYHLAVGEQATRELPVVSPVTLGAGQTWSFSTWARVKPAESWRGGGWAFNREVVVEWRNAGMAVIAQTSIGLPPWVVTRPLYVGTATPNRILGSEPYVVRPEALSNVAQWYQGFESLVVPLSQWLDLRPDFREAMVSCARPIVFIGFARPGQSLSSVDRAMLPVEFRDGPTTYAVPWPYSEPRTRNAQVSWVSRSDTSSIVDGASSPLVIGRVAAWAASEDLVADPLPETRLLPRFTKHSSPEAKWSLRILTTEYRPLGAAVAVLLISVAGWIALRRRPRAAVAVILVICAAVPIVLRRQLRPGPSSETRERVLEVADGLQLRTVKAVEVGAAPLGARAVDPNLARTAVFSEETTKETEIRMAGTPIGFGAMFNPSLGWDSAQRSWLRREVGRFPSIRVADVRPDRIVFDYESPERVDYAVAFWAADGMWAFGEMELPHPIKGKVTLPNQMLLPRSRSTEVSRRDDFRQLGIHLIQVRADGVKEFASLRPLRGGERARLPFAMDAGLQRGVDGTYECTLRVPAGAIATGWTATARLYGEVDVRELLVVTEKGSWQSANQLPPRNPGSGISSTGVFDISAEAVGTVANGGIVRLKLRPASEPTPGLGLRAMVSFGGKKS